MTSLQKLSSFVIGLAMFSMFFGSGNLIFPLFVGQQAADGWLSAYSGFFFTAVAFPFLGVIAMVVYKGDYHKFFSILGKKGGFLLTLLLLTVWIPLGSGPRCIVLAHAGLVTNEIINIPFWIYSLVYSVVISILVFKKNRMLEVLGKYLTPALLICLGYIVFKVFASGAVPPSYDVGETLGFVGGLKEGYNTMDLIASFFFSSAIIDILMRSTHNKKDSVIRTLKSGMIGVSILGIVYFFMVWVGAAYSLQLSGVRKDQLLVHIAHVILGGPLGFIAAIAVMLACMTTSVALLNVYADFLADDIFQDRKQEKLGIIVTQVVTFIISLIGLDGITSITQPVFQVCYPLLFILIVINLTKKFFFEKKQLCPSNG